MARHKDLNWNLPEGDPNHSWQSIHAALMMDIRDELKRLNYLLYCPNFTGIPQELRQIRKNTAKSKKVK